MTGPVQPAAQPPVTDELAEAVETGKAPNPWRIVLLIALLCVIAAAAYVLFFTDPGAQLRADPHLAGRHFKAWVKSHHLIAPGILLLLYFIGTLSLMPVWWLQILAGYGFGFWLGTAYSLVGATIGAVASFLMSRLLLADYVRRRFESRNAKLRELDEKMGHNGLLIVMAARLMHFLPFGVSNYLFGVSRITLMDVVLGTFLGNAGHRPLRRRQRRPPPLPQLALHGRPGRRQHPPPRPRRPPLPPPPMVQTHRCGVKSRTCSQCRRRHPEVLRRICVAIGRYVLCNEMPDSSLRSE